MAKNDIFFKILFAVELALLPMVVFASVMIKEEWGLGLFIAGVLLIKIWLELFKDKNNKTHIIINAIASVAVFATIIILYMVKGDINKVFGIFAVVLVVIYNVMLVCFYGRTMPELISAVDFCYMLFECLALLTLAFAFFYNVPAIIALVALMLTAAFSIGYKVYYLVRFGLIKPKS